MNHPSTAVTIGQIKRALEWWSCSERFRRLVQTDPDQAQREFGLDVHPDRIRCLWDRSSASEIVCDVEPIDPSLRAYLDFVSSQRRRRIQMKSACASDNPRLNAWRDRQIARNLVESGGYEEDVIHAPVAIELTDGCSVGCWFCGVAAGTLAGVWRYTGVNAALWRDVVKALRATIGDAARWGFLYWATDPLDNPDYEQFALDFCRITGTFPQTTTANGHHDPPRIRRLLEMSEGRGCQGNRFSVLSERQLRQIFDEYSADELAGVEILPQMPGGTTPRPMPDRSVGSRGAPRRCSTPNTAN
jgi:radical SAM family RiPP maturation amino acid epimerase